MTTPYELQLSRSLGSEARFLERCVPSEVGTGDLSDLLRSRRDQRRQSEMNSKLPSPPLGEVPHVRLMKSIASSWGSSSATVVWIIDPQRFGHHPQT